MSETTNISIRMDKNLKEQLEELYAELGMNITTAFNIFARQSVREGRIPFTVSLNRPNADTIAAIEEVKQMEKDPSLGKSYNSVKGMIEELLND